VTLDFELALANEPDLAVGAELLAEHTDLRVLGDKGYASAPVAEVLWDHNRAHPLALHRVNQHEQLPESLTRLIYKVR